MYTSSKKKVSQRVGKVRTVKSSQDGKAMYDLCLDRRVANRRDGLMPGLEGIGDFERRRLEDRRVDKRPLNEFPYLPEVVI